MAFANFTCVDEVVKKYRLVHIPAPVLPPDPSAPPFDDRFRSELTFNLRMFRIGRSEEGCADVLLFPILREVWKHYADELALFSHEELAYDGDLTGIPDYFVCKISEFGRLIPDVPYLLVAEAKLDNFERAWGQCSAAMLAAQKLNQAPDVPVYGLATNGRAWEFGRLLGRELVTDPLSTSLSETELLSQRLHAVFRAVRDQAVAHVRPSAA